MNDVEAYRANLKHAIRRADEWLDGLPRQEFGPESGESIARHAIDAIRELLPRTDSELLRVAMYGVSCSGKTFLASALQGGTDYVTIPNSKGKMSHKYLGLLPSTTTTTTACPARITPAGEGLNLDASGSGYLRVQFTDKKEAPWENIGNSVPSPVISAYVVVGADPTGRARRQDYDRSVAEVEILYKDFKIPAELYDLPGFGTGNQIHDDITLSAMSKADCFIFVAHATRALRANERDDYLLRALYKHYSAFPHKKIMWVLTAIDLAENLEDSNTEAWENTLEDNDNYLRENFKGPDGTPDAGFIGGGFVGVSPALEAKAKYHFGRSEDQTGRELLAASRMDSLRRELTGVIEAGAGQRHLSDLAREALQAIEPVQRVITGKLDAERLPYGELSNEQEKLQESLRSIDDMSSEAEAHLRKILERRIRAIEGRFDGFAGYLHRELDQQINETDFSKTKEVNAIEVRAIQVVRSWMTASDGPATIWLGYLEDLDQAAVKFVTARLGKEPSPILARPRELNIDELAVLKSKHHQRSSISIIQKTAAFVGVATPVAAAAAWGLGALAVTVAAIPAGAIAGLAASVYMISGIIRGRRSKSDNERQEQMAHLDAEAVEIKQAFLAAAHVLGNSVIDAVEDYFLVYRNNLMQSLIYVEDRLSEPDTIERKQIIDRLTPICDGGEKIISMLVSVRDLEAREAN